MRSISCRRGFYGIVVVSMLVLLGCSGSAPEGGPARPSILLITVDGLVAADLEPFGGTLPMPRMQGLVDSSASWPAALSAVPMTRPAVATYLTGVAPDRHGVRDDLFAALPAEIPTLAERLTAAGYRTAGFPDSSFLPDRSGLWRGFEIVDRPPPVPINGGRWLPAVRPPKMTGDAFSAWLDSLAEGDEWFGWIHLSLPLVGQLKQQYFTTELKDEATPEEAVQVNDPAGYAETLAEFDALLGVILDRVEGRPGASNTAVILAGTMGDQRRDDSSRLPGLGFSLAPEAVHVPVVARFPGGAAVGRADDAEVWSPDVAATVAVLTGVSLSPDAEGRSLTEPGVARTVFSWSWALLDQLGWRRLALARDATGELVVGTPGSGDAPSAALQAALDARTNPVRAGLPENVVADLTGEFEIVPEPLDVDGRDFDDEEVRRRITAFLWMARAKFQLNKTATPFLTPTKRRWDPGAYAAHLDSGQTMALRGLGAAKRITRKATELRPDDPEAWHWYAHAIWRDSWESGEKIITAIQPYLANQADALYDLACARSLAGELEASADYLERAYLAGFRNRDHISSDPDLRNLRESEHFARVMQRFH